MTEQPSTIDQLESRLQRGWELIDEAESQSDQQAAARYTRRWLSLLTDYEALARQQPRAEIPGPDS